MPRLLAVSFLLASLLVETTQGQTPVPCVCPKYPCGQGMQGGQMVYYYYSLACPGNNPVMYVSTTPIAQFNGGCVAGGCAGSVVIPTIAKPTPVPMAEAADTTDPALSTVVSGSDDPAKLGLNAIPSSMSSTAWPGGGMSASRNTRTSSSRNLTPMSLSSHSRCMSKSKPAGQT